MIKSLTEQCSTEELRIQTLQGTIRHKMSEYPIVSARMSEIDHQAIDLYNTLMDSQAVPVDTSPTFRPFDLPSPSSVEAESDIDGYVASRGSDATRASAVRPSAPALLKDFSAHLEKAEQEVKESKMNMLEREEKLRKAAAVLGRDQEIVSRTHQVNISQMDILTTRSSQIAELERRIQQRKHDIAAIRARQQMQNSMSATRWKHSVVLFVLLTASTSLLVALLSAAIVGCIAICVAAVIFSLRQDGEQT
jgi:hypothetical protein